MNVGILIYGCYPSESSRNGASTVTAGKYLPGVNPTARAGADRDGQSFDARHATILVNDCPVTSREQKGTARRMRPPAPADQRLEREFIGEDGAHSDGRAVN